MKNFILLTTFILAVCASVFAQPKTVTDFYLAMPNDIYATDIEGRKLTSKPALTKFRKSLIKVEDIKNGYLRLEGTWEGWAEIALFKKSDGGYIIGRVETGCGPVCGGSINFYTYKTGKWTDVTKQVLPAVDNKTIAEIYNSKIAKDAEKISNADEFAVYFVLPRQGRTLKLECNECDLEGAILEFEWKGAKFIKK